MTTPIKNNGLSNSPIKQNSDSANAKHNSNVNVPLTTVQNTVNTLELKPAKQVASMQAALGIGITVVTQRPEGEVTKPTIWMSKTQPGKIAFMLPGETKVRTFSNLPQLQHALPDIQVTSMQAALGSGVAVVTQKPEGEVTKPTVWMSKTQSGKIAFMLPGETKVRTFSNLPQLQHALPDIQVTSMQAALGSSAAVVTQKPEGDVTKPTVWMSKTQPGKIALMLPDDTKVRTFSNLPQLQNALPSTEISSMELAPDIAFPTVPGTVDEKNSTNNDADLEKRIVALRKGDIGDLEEKITMLNKKDTELTETKKNLETELGKAKKEKTDIEEKLSDAQKKLETSKNELEDLKNEPKPSFPDVPGTSDIDVKKRLIRLMKHEVRTLAGKVALADKQIKTIENKQTVFTRQQDQAGLEKRLAERELNFEKNRLAARSQEGENFSSDFFINSLKAGLPKQLTTVEDIFYHIKRNFGPNTFNVVWESYKNKVPLEKGATLSQHGIDSINNFTKKYDSVRSLFTFSTDPPGMHIDATRVALDLMKLPTNVLNKALSLGQKIIITNDNITNSEDTEDLKGQKAGGNAVTWDVIPGAGSLGHTTIAMIQKPSGEWMISDQHSTSNLVLHEFSHSIDFCFGELAGLGKYAQPTSGDSVSNREDFRNAWKADLSKTSPGSADDYFWQNGTAEGAREAFAEAMADIYSGKNEHNWPNVKNFLKPFMESIQ